MKILDFHCHIGEDKDGTKRTLAIQKEEMRQWGISHSVVFPFDEVNQCVEEASFKLLEEIAPEKNIISFFRCDPKRITEETLREALKKEFRGVKLHPRSQQFDPRNESFAWIFEMIAQSGKPLLIHTRCEGLAQTDPLHVAKLTEQFPNLKLVLAHFGGGLKETAIQLKEQKNLFVETSVYACTSAIKKFVEVCGSEKILFGSDAPYSDMQIELMKIQKSEITEKEKVNILFKNSAKILKINE